MADSGCFVWKDTKKPASLASATIFELALLQQSQLIYFSYYPTDSRPHLASSGFLFNGLFWCFFLKKDWVAQYDFPYDDSSHKMFTLAYLEWW